MSECIHCMHARMHDGEVVTCVKLAPEQSARYLAEIGQDLEQQRPMPCQASGEGTDRYHNRSVPVLELPADLLPLSHQFSIRLTVPTHVLCHNPCQSLHIIMIIIRVMIIIV